MKTVLVKVQLTDEQYNEACNYISYMRRKFDPNYNMDKYITMILKMYFTDNERDDDNE